MPKARSKYVPKTHFEQVPVALVKAALEGGTAPGVSESAWLFRRGSNSVRLVRTEHANGCSVSVFGPGTEFAAYEFRDVVECMKQQAVLEQQLQTAGYQLARITSDRRQLHQPGPRRHVRERAGDFAAPLSVN